MSSGDRPATQPSGVRAFFVSPFLAGRNGRQYGGSLVSQRNLRVVAAALGTTSLRVYSVGPPRQAKSANADIPIATSRWGGAISVLALHCRKLLPRSLRYLEEELRRHRPAVVFLDSTLLGRLSSVIRRCCPATRVICFAHNVEAEFFTSALWMTPRHLIELPAVILNEALAVRRSDAVVYLSDEDAVLSRKLYGSHKSEVFPVTLPAPPAIAGDVRGPAMTGTESRIKVLFVGSPFYANLRAVKVIVEEIAPALPEVEFQVAGIARAQGPAKVPCNLRLLGHVPDLVETYCAAHAVILPIYYGAGVKVKVAEALLHGKPVLATPLALRGFEVKAGGILVCEQPQDFVAGIRSLATGGNKPPNFEQQRLRHDAGAAEPALAQRLTRLISET